MAQAFDDCSYNVSIDEELNESHEKWWRDIRLTNRVYREQALGNDIDIDEVAPIWDSLPWILELTN
ncbi:MAG: hypothetical protein WAM14_08315 [Candidatus Nitrosopolaris sp.]